MQRLSRLSRSNDPVSAGATHGQNTALMRIKMSRWMAQRPRTARIAVRQPIGEVLSDRNVRVPCNTADENLRFRQNLHTARPLLKAHHAWRCIDFFAFGAKNTGPSSQPRNR